MTYLLDTNVLSETRKRQPAVGVAEWIAATPPDRMHISVLTLGEIERGSRRAAGGETGTKLLPWNAGSKTSRPGSGSGFSRSPSRSPPPGDASHRSNPSLPSAPSSPPRPGSTA
jgi:hypothetical protein